MHRRGAGVGAIKNRSVVQAKFKDKGSELASEQLAEMATQMEKFKVNLEEFATRHKEDIKKDASFRSQFQQMCAAIGVDPLASSKGFWCSLLGVGDFYYELGVQLMEVCIAATPRTGGLMELDELRRRLLKSRGPKKQAITNDDILTCVKTMKVLGDGLKSVKLSEGRYLIQSVPGELSMDHTTVLNAAQKKGYTSASQLKTDLQWHEERVNYVLNFMVGEGLAWVDEQALGGTIYWFPGFFQGTQNS